MSAAVSLPRRARIVEHKSSSEDVGPGSAYWRRLTLDGQVSTYFVGTRALGYEPVGVLYDVAKRPALRPLKATPVESRKYTAKGFLYANQRETDETPEQFADRLRNDIAENPEKYYQRGTVVRLEKEETAAAKDTWNLARWIREVQLEADPEAWPRNPEACSPYGSTCEFMPVCLGEASVDDPSRYRKGAEHEELDGKRRLPIVTTSSLKCFRACPRKYYFRYELGVKSLGMSDALRFGRLWHAGLEHYWRSGFDLEAGIAAMQAAESDPYELVKASVLLEGYHARWADEPMTLLGVEVEFTAPLRNPATGAASKTFELAGKIDALVEVE